MTTAVLDEVLTRTDDRDGDDSWATTWSVENRPDEDVVCWFLAEASLTPLSKWQVANAERICQLANMFGHLPINRDGQTPNNLLNLSIPCAQLIKTGIVTGVTDTFDGVNDQSVQDVERYCRMAVTRAEDMHGEGWYTNEAKRLNLP